MHNQQNMNHGQLSISKIYPAFTLSTHVEAKVIYNPFNAEFPELSETLCPQLFSKYFLAHHALQSSYTISSPHPDGSHAENLAVVFNWVTMTNQSNL
jgi:hypothetical protein